MSRWLGYLDESIYNCCMKVVHGFLVVAGVALGVLVSAQPVYAILIGVPIVAVSLVKIIAVLLGILAVPTSVITQAIKKDTKKTLIITGIILFTLGVILFVIFSVFSSNQEVSFVDNNYTDSQIQGLAAPPTEESKLTTPNQMPISVTDFVIKSMQESWQVMALLFSVPLVVLFYAVHVLYSSWSVKKLWGVGAVTYISLVLFSVVVLAVISGHNQGVFIIS